MRAAAFLSPHRVSFPPEACLVVYICIHALVSGLALLLLLFITLLCAGS